MVIFLGIEYTPKSENDGGENKKDYTNSSCSAFSFAKYKLKCRASLSEKWLYSQHFWFKR